MSQQTPWELQDIPEEACETPTTETEKWNFVTAMTATFVAFTVIGVILAW